MEDYDYKEMRETTQKLEPYGFELSGYPGEWCWDLHDSQGMLIVTVSHPNEGAYSEDEGYYEVPGWWALTDFRLGDDHLDYFPSLDELLANIDNLNEIRNATY